MSVNTIKIFQSASLHRDTKQRERDANSEFWWYYDVTELRLWS